LVKIVIFPILTRVWNATGFLIKIFSYTSLCSAYAARCLIWKYLFSTI